MLKKVIWSHKAQLDRKEVIEYWTHRNKSNVYSIKLNKLFKESIQLIKKHPRIGKKTDIKNVRAKIIRDYIMFYEIQDKRIIILTIWSSKQDPKKLDKISKE